MSYCAIDFGTSNSAVAVPGRAGMRLAAIEGTHTTLPTAVFFNADEHSRAFGRAALAAHVDGYDGRLMRSIKSILGSPLAERSTDLGDGSAIRYTEIIALFVEHLVQRAQTDTGARFDHAVLGRPVYFVDEHPDADRIAQQQLADAARAAGLRHVEFLYEPIAAALAYEAELQQEALVLVADIGGGTSDFSLVRVGPERARAIDRRDDVLAHHGVHVAGTDFDRRVELDAILPEFGYRSTDTAGREIPSGIYHDLATWHLINTVYTPKRAAEFRHIAHLYRDPQHHARLMRVIQLRLGHRLAALAEAAKIGVSNGGQTVIGLDEIEAGLARAYDEAMLARSVREDIERIAVAARETVRQAGVAPHEVDAIYFTGGSTGLRCLTDALAASFPAAQKVTGDRLASVATGLGIHAHKLFG